MLLLKEDIIKKGRVNKSLKLELKLNIENNIEHKVEAIKDSAVYAIKTIGQLSGSYYLVF